MNTVVEDYTGQSLFQNNPCPLCVFNLDTLLCEALNKAALSEFELQNPLPETLLIYHLFKENKSVQEYIQSAKENQQSQSTCKVFLVKETKKKRRSLLIISFLKSLSTHGTLQFIQPDEKNGFILYPRLSAQLTHMKAFMKHLSWVHSHLLRGKVANMLGLLQLETDVQTNPQTKQIILDMLMTEATLLDDAIRNTVVWLKQFHEVNIQGFTGKGTQG